MCMNFSNIHKNHKAYCGLTSMFNMAIHSYESLSQYSIIISEHLLMTRFAIGNTTVEKEQSICGHVSDIEPWASM